MNDSWKEKLSSFLTLALAGIILVGGAVVIWPKFLRSRSLMAQDQELQRRIDAKRQEICQLQENQRRFKTDPDFVEAIARQNGRVYPGELVFIFENSSK